MEEPKITVNGKEVEAIGMKETVGFADREDLMEAFEYAISVIERSTSPEMAIYGTTAIQVVWNTIANKYHLISKEDV
jgi:hypothetical protein